MSLKITRMMMRMATMKFEVITVVVMIVISIILSFVTYSITFPNNLNNLSTLLTGSITELHLWGYINGQPEYDVNMNYTYIAITPHEQELGFMNQTSYGYGNMLFLFNNDTSHCFWDKNTGTNLTLYWIDWKNQTTINNNELVTNTKLGTVITITNLTAYNTTPECVVSDAVMESTSPQILDANDFITIIYNS